MNSNEKIGEQAEWLDRILTGNEEKWVICTFHHPMFSTGKDRDNSALRAVWKPILDKHRVDLVLQGHDHTYGRTGLDTPSEPEVAIGNVPAGVTHRDDHHGTVYVVSVSGPGMSSLDPDPVMVRVAENTQLYQIIHIDGLTLRYEAHTAIGELYDSFTLEKTVGQPNRILEASGLMAEQRPDRNRHSNQRARRSAESIRGGHAVEGRSVEQRYVR